MRAITVLVASSAIFGCAETQSYIYTPQTANAIAQNLPASRTPIPPERPEGTVEVTSTGITEIPVTGQNVQVLHVRMVVANDGDDVPWQVDTRQQFVSIPGEGRSLAMYVNSDLKTFPIITIARHEHHVVDLYFPLPENLRDEAHLASFEVQWQVTTPARVVSSHTTFDRREQEQPEPAEAWPYWPGYGPAGFGPYWWYDPFYPHVVFVHVPRGHAHVDHRR